MDFPAYVPAAVRAFISDRLHGDEVFDGSSLSLDRAKQELAKVDEKISTLIQRGDVKKLDKARTTRAAYVEQVSRLNAEVGLLHRLGSDKRMAEAYALLTKELTEDKQWQHFINDAIGTKIDFAEQRKNRKRLVEMKSEIAEAAAQLAQLLRSFDSRTGYRGPEAFVSIPELLRRTEQKGINHYKHHLALPYLLGRRPYRGFNEVCAAAEHPSQSYAPKDQAEEIENVGRHGWLPDFPSLLDTVAKAARDYEVRAPGVIEAAISTRQHSEKTAYIRAFGTLLTDIHGFTLTRPLMKAIAIVTSVAINDPDIDVTPDDVRKAIGKPENSRQK